MSNKNFNHNDNVSFMEGIYGCLERIETAVIEFSLLASSEQMFAEGVEMLKSGNATIHAVMDECGYNEYFRTYIKSKHPELLHRKTERKPIVRKQKTADKYAAAIECMRNSTDTMKDIAERFGLNIHSFRKYLYKYIPEIIKSRHNKP